MKFTTQAHPFLLSVIPLRSVCVKVILLCLAVVSFWRTHVEGCGMGQCKQK